METNNEIYKCRRCNKHDIIKSEMHTTCTGTYKYLYYCKPCHRHYMNTYRKKKRRLRGLRTAVGRCSERYDMIYCGLLFEDKSIKQICGIIGLNYQTTRLVCKGKVKKYLDIVITERL